MPSSVDSSCLQHPKVVTLENLCAHVEKLKETGSRIVFTNGCFDIIHPGHVDLLARAKALGDSLVLGLNSDSSVRLQNKGENRPVNTFSVRAFVLAHLASVDFVVEFDQATPYELILSIRPHILVKGGDWAKKDIIGGDIVTADGGDVCSLTLLSGFSTTNLITRIQQGKPAF